MTKLSGMKRKKKSFCYGQYRVSKAQLHIAGDGAQWIKYGLTIFPKAQYHLDKFHVYKSVTDVVGGDRVLRRQIIDALMSGDWNKIATNSCEILAILCMPKKSGKVLCPRRQTAARHFAVR